MNDDSGSLSARLSHLRPTPGLFDCPRHGTQEVARLTSTCPACYREHLAEREAEHRAEQRRQRAKDRRAALGLDARFADATLTGFECTTSKQQAAVQACRSFVAGLPGEGAGLLLIGPPGTGKSTLAAATCLAAIDQRDVSARMVTQREVIRRLRATWRRDAIESEDDVIAELGRTGLFVLDDAGVSYGGEAEVVQLLDLVDLRYRQRLPTMVCTNLNLPQLRAALGDRTFDRLREGAATVLCDWPSFRGRS